MNPIETIIKHIFKEGCGIGSNISVPKNPRAKLGIETILLKNSLNKFFSRKKFLIFNNVFIYSSLK